jgi:hypothetical protein
MSQVELLPSPALPAGVEDKWRAEQQAFRRLLPALLKQYRDEYVAIHEGNVVASGSDKLEVAGRAYTQIGYVPIYVGHVTDQAPPLCRIHGYSM